MNVISHSDVDICRKPKAATIGMFDGVHLGHASLIDFLKNEALQRNLCPAVITFGVHPQLLFNPDTDLRMLFSVDERISQLDSLGIDHVILLDFNRQLAALSANEFIKFIHDEYNVRLLVMGFNHRFGNERDLSFSDYVEIGSRVGVEIILAPEYLGENSPVSSSIIRKLIESGQVDYAAKCMGRLFSITGIVQHGFKNGRTIGYPTANIGSLNPHQLIPHRGAYAVKVLLPDGRHLLGMANIGVRPTLDNGSNESIEVNIFDFNEDIYDSVITVQFVKFLRAESKMNSIDELRRQLAADETKARLILLDK